MLYLSAVYILNPGFNLLLHYGKILSHRQGGAAADPSSYSVDINVIHNNDGEKGSTLEHLKPLKVAREDATKIMQRLKEIKNEKMSVQKRKELIRKVIPDWFRHGGMDVMEHSDIGGGAGSAIDGAGIVVEEHVEESAKNGKQKNDNGQVEAQSNSNGNINAEEDVVPDAPGHIYHGGESAKNGKQKVDDGQVEAQSNSNSNAEEDVIPDAPAHTYHGGESVNEKQKIDDGQMEAHSNSNSNSNSNAEEDVVPDAPAHTDIDPDAVPHADLDPDTVPHVDLDAVQEEQSAIDPTVPDEDQRDIHTSDIIRTLRNKGQHHKQSLCPRDLHDISTTMVVQSTFDRLPLMKQTCQRWNDPINLVVYLTEEESKTIWQQTVEDYSKSCPHLILIPYIAKSDEERRLEYPINKMRNIGLDHVMTSHVLVVDIDLIPSQGLDRAVNSAIDLTIQARVDDDGDRGVDPKDAITIPAFERKDGSDSPCKTLQDCQKLSAEDDTFIPKSMQGLRECIKENKCIVFQSDVNREGHFDTMSSQWLESNHTDALTTIECFHSQRYEPYVVIPWCPLEKNARQRLAIRSPRSPYYDERFHGYGKNKIQQIAHLRERGYTFVTMPTTGFFMHHPHPESETKEIWNDKANHDLHESMDKLYPKYLLELYHEYEGHHLVTPICQRTRSHVVSR